MVPLACEVNFDGLVGPTHHYGGLAAGNLASARHRHHLSNPAQAALQGLAKMKAMTDLGLQQAVVPPQERPALDLLRRAGFDGSDVDLVAKAHRDAPELLSACYSAASMWAANAATICPSMDARDKRVHLTPANLLSELHRHIEPQATAMVLRRIFACQDHFVHHRPLPASWPLRDEGAANHMRLCRSLDEPGLQLFIFGTTSGSTLRPKRFEARQSQLASEAIARMHNILPQRVLFVQQNTSAIDAGVFHNDLVAMGHRDVVLYHGEAFLDTAAVIDRLRSRFDQVCGAQLTCIAISPQQLSLHEAVTSYLFNSQLLSLPDQTKVLIAPAECRHNERVRAILETIAGPGRAIAAIHYADVRQSMQNGGGPACLRLPVVLTPAELARIHQPVLLTEALFDQLTTWIGRHYRTQLGPHDLADPHLIDETRNALDELTGILQLGSLYPFQQV